ncbi:MAG: hypothetical protein ACW99Q_05570, partial [Candidatus Kariarchaeaceae archaeon]
YEAYLLYFIDDIYIYKNGHELNFHVLERKNRFFRGTIELFPKNIDFSISLLDIYVSWIIR